ncbi:extracellular solute-binding protein [Streptoalloteichus hindustanus]|uniref:Carbohydrate ABC transporter substrate-binding protein, CUT1 family n=1 Tax=Streptoalloteichus hindustanus TaxID=2017 RepID=A0A1M4WAY5_STRHI|nr:extracellular solute-binding protein [Streptoalloteichus hindustanus]SHE78394.1 carbohydrate ABC transporter substrate-binding protein, CUT1 family [Streptoalloteichus hindustanus]
MRIGRGLAAATAAVIGAVVAVGCAPVQARPDADAGDSTTGTLRVWLFDEATRAPKEAVVREAAAEFEAAHSGVRVEVQYVQVDSRAERFKAAFNDPKSAPDVAEFGNTDLAGYVAAGGFADLGADLRSWADARDITPSVLDTAKVDGRTYGVPWFVGIRALYYRTDLFEELGLRPPRTTAELVTTARRIRELRPELYGISVGGKYTYAMLPFLWAAGGDLARRDGAAWVSTVDDERARAGMSRYAELLRDDVCPPAQCAQMTGSSSVQAFAAGKSAMTIGGDFNRRAVDAGVAAGRYAVVPLPGEQEGSIAPAFAGGNLLGVLRSTQHRTLAVRFTELLAGKKYQRKMFDAMGNLPTFTDLQRAVAEGQEFQRPFVTTLTAGTRFVPATPTWAKIDAQNVLPTAVQEIATGAKPAPEATRAAAERMNAAFRS